MGVGFSGANLSLASPMTPTRHSPKAVARFKHFIDAVTLNYPNPIIVDPAPLSMDTFACRFRDAVAGVLRYGSAPELHQAVSIWASDYMVASIKGTGQLAIGKTSVIKERMKPEVQVGQVLDASVRIDTMIVTPSERVLAAIITLMEHNILEHATLNGVDEKSVIEACANCTRTIEIINQNGVITLL